MVSLLGDIQTDGDSSSLLLQVKNCQIALLDDLSDERARIHQTG